MTSMVTMTIETNLIGPENIQMGVLTLFAKNS